ncbi:MAG TPA: tetratricopeptide repeat protein [Rhizomicrobium sp.]|nr:tetratricopeptide repeat protein [Rhizomicrobium sp.]
MKKQLAIAALIAAATFASSAAYADAVVVIGEGPERACYLSAKSGQDSIAGIGHCNMALNNPLIVQDRVATLVNRGVILHQLNRIEPAMTDFNAALRIDPEHADAYLNRGVAKMTLGQVANALVDIQKGIDLGPSEIALAYYDRAIAHERLGNIREAYFDYQRALRAAPNFTAAANALSRFKVTPKT